jgi:hypothetical protein
MQLHTYTRPVGLSVRKWELLHYQDCLPQPTQSQTPTVPTQDFVVQVYTRKIIYVYTEFYTSEKR